SRSRPLAAATHGHGALLPRFGRSPVAASRGPDQRPHEHGRGMTDMKFGRRCLVALAVPVAAAACSSSPNPVLYTIETRPGPTFAAGPKIVMLRDISLASYLDRK